MKLLRDTVEADVLFRSSGDKEYIDVGIELYCPACPIEVDPGKLELDNEYKGNITATCPKCQYKAIVSVYEDV